MTDKTKPNSAKKKPKKAAAQQSVLGSLPATRPSRLARRHGAPEKVEPTAKTDGPVAVAAPSPTPRATEPAKKAGTTSAKPAAASRRRAPARTKAAAPKTTAQTTAAVAAAQPSSAAEAPTAKEPSRRATEAPPRRRPQPVRPGSPPLGQKERRDAPPPPNGGGPRGTELVTTAIQAAGELAQIGITVGSQLLKRTLERLPKP
jgi:hypothetical protein